MKTFLAIILCLAVLPACRTVAPKKDCLKEDCPPRETAEAIFEKLQTKAAAPAPEPSWYEVYPFHFTLEWDANPPEDQVLGYYLHLGEQTLNYVAKIRLPNVTEQRVLNNHPVTYCAVSAFNSVGEGEISDEAVYVRSQTSSTMRFP